MVPITVVYTVSRNCLVNGVVHALPLSAQVETLQDPVLHSYQQIVNQRRGELLLTSQSGMIEFRLGPEGLEPVAE